MVDAWNVDVANDAHYLTMLKPVTLMQHVLVERGYDEALAKARSASKTDPFAFHRGLARLAKNLLFDGKPRPKRLATLLTSYAPDKAKLPAVVASLQRTPAKSEFQTIVNEIGSPSFAKAMFQICFAKPLLGSDADKLSTANRLDKLGRAEVSVFDYVMLSQPDLTELLINVTTAQPAGKVRDALIVVFTSIDRYIVDVRSRPLLLASLASASATSRWHAGFSILRCAQVTSWPKENRSNVIALLADTDSYVRSQIASAIMAFSETLTAKEIATAEPLFEQGLADTSKQMRINSAAALARFRGRAFLPTLTKLIKSAKISNERRAIEFIARDIS
jgi:hypothetical protein